MLKNNGVEWHCQLGVVAGYRTALFSKLWHLRLLHGEVSKSGWLSLREHAIPSDGLRGKDGHSLGKHTLNPDLSRLRPLSGKPHWNLETRSCYGYAEEVWEMGCCQGETSQGWPTQTPDWELLFGFGLITLFTIFWICQVAVNNLMQSKWLIF